MRRLLLVFALVLSLVSQGEARQRTQKTVQNERKAATRVIEQSKRELNKNEQQTRSELLNLQSIEGEIRVQKTEIERLEAESAGLKQRSKALGDTIEANEAHLKDLRVSYSKALRNLRRQRQLAGDMSFIFSSSSFAQARSRIRYLKELSQWQTGKTNEISEETALLSQRRERLDSVQQQLCASLDSLGRVKAALGRRKLQADAVVGSLKRRSKDLQRVISEQQRLVKKLDDELNRIIEAEARAAAEAKRKAAEAAQRQADRTTPSKPSQSSNTTRPAAPADCLTEPFEQCMGRLPWPLDRNAIITSTFGQHTHESLERVTVQNNGIDFETSPGASARAVYDGTVSMVIVMEGYQNVVLVRHGEYLTVYAGLHNLRVRKGDTVKGGQLLGDVFSDPADANRTKLHFEVRHEKEKLDPQLWLRK